MSGIAGRMRSLLERVERDNHKPVAWVLGQADFDEFRVWTERTIAEYVQGLAGGVYDADVLDVGGEPGQRRFLRLPVLYSTRPSCIELLVEPVNGADFPVPYVTGALTAPTPHPLASALTDIAASLRKLDLTLQRAARAL